MLNLTWVRTFLALIQSKSFRTAAERLHIAQPTVSLHIQKLEEQLGALLIRRARSGCEPTSAAMAFLPYAQSLIRLNDRAVAAVKGDHVRVGASSNIGIYMLQPYIGTFLHGRDPSTFDLVIDRNPAIATKLEDGEVDVALMEWWDCRPGFIARLWKSEPVVLIVPLTHSLASSSGLSKSELYNLELLGGEPGTGTGRLLDAYFMGDGTPRVSLQLGSTEAVKQAVKAGVGISLVLESSVVDEVQSGRLRAIPLVEPPMKKDLFVIWRNNSVRHLPPPVFVQHIVSNGDFGEASPRSEAVGA